jgi:hypothetical protein
MCFDGFGGVVRADTNQGGGKLIFFAFDKGQTNAEVSKKTKSQKILHRCYFSYNSIFDSSQSRQFEMSSKFRTSPHDRLNLVKPQGHNNRGKEPLERLAPGPG